ncbi:S8 family peptidase [Pseudalkalibacillus salsuginis]|uniref:S8 family peptidase n=1 Tax=Pseudalkalibacillus salsuginis TaxID=2910972 RepID=UPI001F22913A|nr:S8 family serine peptidase [Pseudalkalibacillus salsuginis]MCF6410094.1 S8 family serine peptidase [Pseudalkalibacillus salsuginis]
MKWYIKLLLSLLVLFVMDDSEISASNNGQSYIVTFKNQIDTEMIHSVGGTVDQKYESIDAASVYLSDEALSELRKKTEILFIEENSPVKTDGQIIDWGYHFIIPEPARSSNFTGKGIKIAVMDTGIDQSHPDLKVAGGTSFINEESHYNDLNGHGTHVAGIISAEQNTIGTLGVAPEASVYAVKVLDKDGNGSQASVISGLEWAIKNDIDIINLSLTSPQGSYALKTMMDHVYEKGILIVAASGNGTQHTSGLDNVHYPARYDSVIAVGSINKDKKRSSFTRYGPTLELSAPGHEIISSFIGGKYTVNSGTSMAAPHVAGALALYMEKYPLKPNKEIRKLIQFYAEDLGDKGKDDLYGYGLVQAPYLNKPKSLSELSGKTESINLSEGKVELNWKASPYPQKLMKYKLYRNGTLIKTLPGHVTSFNDEIAYGEYTYSVKVSDPIGQASDSKSISIHLKSDFKGFLDVKVGDWFGDAVFYLKGQNFVSGYTDGTFRPKNNITRGEMATVIARVLGMDTSAQETVFEDVKASYYASGAIQSLYEAQIISGFPDGTFQPAVPISRGDAAIMITKAFDLPPPDSYQSFPDVSDSYYGFTAIQTLSAEGILNGYPDGTIRPKALITRAEMASLIERAIKNK